MRWRRRSPAVLLLLFRLPALLLLLPYVNCQGEREWTASCGGLSICPIAGNVPLHPSRILPPPTDHQWALQYYSWAEGVTCGDLVTGVVVSEDEYLPVDPFSDEYNALDRQCLFQQLYWGIEYCGCAAPATVPSLCSGSNEPPPDPLLLLDKEASSPVLGWILDAWVQELLAQGGGGSYTAIWYNDFTCADAAQWARVQYFAPWNSLEYVELAFQLLAYYCDCPTNVTTTTSCKLCEDGSTPLPNATAKPFKPQGMPLSGYHGNAYPDQSCDEWNTIAQHFEANSTACSTLQHSTAAYSCGCTAPLNGCPMCSHDTSLPESNNTTEISRYEHSSNSLTCSEAQAMFPFVVNAENCLQEQLVTGVGFCGCPFPDSTATTTINNNSTTTVAAIGTDANGNLNTDKMNTTYDNNHNNTTTFPCTMCPNGQLPPKLWDYVDPYLADTDDNILPLIESQYLNYLWNQPWPNNVYSDNMENCISAAIYSVQFDDRQACDFFSLVGFYCGCKPPPLLEEERCATVQCSWTTTTTSSRQSDYCTTFSKASTYVGKDSLYCPYLQETTRDCCP